MNKWTQVILIILMALSPKLYAKSKEFKEQQKKIFKQLDLSEEQRKSLKKIRKEKKGVIKSLMTEKKELRKKMNSALKSDASEDQLRQLHNQITTIHIKIKDSKFNRMLSIRSILKPDQRNKFFDLKQEMKKNRKK